jgi:citrate synthase
MESTKHLAEMERLALLCKEHGKIDPAFYSQFDVKQGLRDVSGKGVLTGLTNISEVCARTVVDGKEVPTDGRLFYRGYEVKDIIKGFSGRRFGFEEVTYLLLFGELPTDEQLRAFTDILAEKRSLPRNFVRDIIMKATSPDMMNIMSRGVLTQYYYDKNAGDNSIENVLRQSLELIARFPLLAVYGYQT